MKNLLIKYPIISLMKPHLNKSLIFLCLVVEDSYSEGIIGGDGFECRILCDFHIGLGTSLGCDDSLILRLLPTNVSCCYRSHFVAFKAWIAAHQASRSSGCILSNTFTHLHHHHYHHPRLWLPLIVLHNWARMFFISIDFFALVFFMQKISYLFFHFGGHSKTLFGVRIWACMW